MGMYQTKKSVLGVIKTHGYAWGRGAYIKGCTGPGSLSPSLRSALLSTCRTRSVHLLRPSDTAKLRQGQMAERSKASDDQVLMEAAWVERTQRGGGVLMKVRSDRKGQEKID